MRLTSILSSLVIKMKNTLRILTISNLKINLKEFLPTTTGIHFFLRLKEMAHNILNTAGRRIKMVGEKKEWSNSWCKSALKMLLSQQVHFSLRALSIKSLSLNSWRRNRTFTKSLMKMVKIVREMAELDGNNSKHFEDLPRIQPFAHSALRKALPTAADCSAWTKPNNNILTRSSA